MFREKPGGEEHVMTIDEDISSTITTHPLPEPLPASNMQKAAAASKASPAIVPPNGTAKRRRIVRSAQRAVNGETTTTTTEGVAQMSDTASIES